MAETKNKSYVIVIIQMCNGLTRLDRAGKLDHKIGKYTVDSANYIWIHPTRLKIQRTNDVRCMIPQCYTLSFDSTKSQSWARPHQGLTFPYSLLSKHFPSTLLLSTTLFLYLSCFSTTLTLSLVNKSKVSNTSFSNTN